MQTMAQQYTKQPNMHHIARAPGWVNTSPGMCEDVELADIDYLAASNPQEAAMRSLRFCEVTHENGCSLDEIAVTEAERDRAALLDSNAKCGYEVQLLEITLYSIALLLIFAVLFTNLLLALVIIRYQTLRTSTNKLILSLAISDCVFALSSIYSEVMNILQSAAEMNYNYERLEQIITVRSIEELCLLLDGPGLIYASMMASVLTLTCIASEKYIAIFHPFQYYRLVTNRNIVISAACIWVFAILFGLTPLVWNTFNGTCSMTEKTAYGYMLLWTCICMACAVLMLTLYTRIFLVAHRQARAIHARQTMFTDEKTNAPRGKVTGKRNANSKRLSTTKSIEKGNIVPDIFTSTYHSEKYTSKHEIEFPRAYQGVNEKLNPRDSKITENTLNVFSFAPQRLDTNREHTQTKIQGRDSMDKGIVNEKLNGPVTLNVTLNGHSKPITITVSSTEQVTNSEVTISPSNGVIHGNRVGHNDVVGNNNCSKTQSGDMNMTQLDIMNSDLLSLEICDPELRSNSFRYDCKCEPHRENNLTVKYTCYPKESNPEHNSNQIDIIKSKYKSETNCCFSKRSGSIESQNLPLILNSNDIAFDSPDVAFNTPETSINVRANELSQTEISLNRNVSSKDIVLQTEQELSNIKPECDIKIENLQEKVQINIPTKKLSVIAESNDDVARKLSLLSPVKNFHSRHIPNPLKPLRRVSTEPLLQTKPLDESVSDKAQARCVPGRHKMAPLRRMATVDGIFPLSNADTNNTVTSHRRSTSRSLFTHKLFPPSFRAVKTIAIILGTFYICWLPLLIYILAFKDRYSNFTINVLAMLALINSLLNPLIYGFKNKGIRAAMKRMVTCGRSKRRGSDTAPSLPYDTAYHVNH